MEKLFTILKSKNDKQTIIKALSNVYGLPEVSKKFSIFIFNDHGEELHLEFKGRDKYITFLLNSKESLIKNSKLAFGNLKAFIKLVSHIGFNDCTVGEVIETTFSIDGHKIIISADTFLGTLLSLEAEEISDQILGKVRDILSPKYTLEDHSEIKKYVQKLKLKRYPLINEFNIINSKIINYADSVGLDVRSLDNSLKSKINSFSNDYGLYEKEYAQITDCQLLDTKITDKKFLLKAPSIVIPSYNSEETIVKVLYSIQSQNLEKDLLKKTEVIVIDDGSKLPVANILEPHIKNFDFDLNIIRLSRNRGLSAARNIGINAAKSDYLIFLDSDILLSKNYVMEHLIRLSIIPNAVFVSFKKNIENSSKTADIAEIIKGLNRPEKYDDLRVNRLVDKDKLGLHKMDKSIYTEILADTNYFKNFGHGRNIGVYDLPSMIVGHNFSTRRKVIENVNGFSDHFKGWGLEDSYFGAKSVATGNFIIPVISCGVYHIDHQPRSGSEQKKQEEFIYNLKVYKELIEAEIQ